jgi:CDP-diacylglycerol--serine O-phosphatidyltransferase
MLAIVYLLAGLMVSEIRYSSFKDVHLHRRHPFPVLIGIIVIVLVTVGAPWPVLATAAVTYAASGPVGALLRRARPARGVTTGSSTAPHLRPVTVDKVPKRS